MKNFGTETKNNRQKIVLYPPFSLLSIKFFDTRSFQTQKGSSKICSGTVRQKNSTENRDTLFPPMHENFRY